MQECLVVDLLHSLVKFANCQNTFYVYAGLAKIREIFENWQSKRCEKTTDALIHINSFFLNYFYPKKNGEMEKVIFEKCKELKGKLPVDSAEEILCEHLFRISRYALDKKCSIQTAIKRWKSEMTNILKKE